MTESPQAARPPKRLRIHWSWDALSLGSLVGIAALLFVLWRLRGVLLVLVASIFLAYVLEPPVALLARCPIGRKRCIGRKAAAAIVVLGATLGIVLGIYWLAPVLWEELNRLGGELPRYYQLIETWMRDMANRRGMGLPVEFWTNVQDQYHALVQPEVEPLCLWIEAHATRGHFRELLKIRLRLLCLRVCLT